MCKYRNVFNMKKKMNNKGNVKGIVLRAIIITLFIIPILLFCWLYIHEKQTTIVAIECFCKVAMCTWGLLGCLGTIVTIVIKASLSNLEELRKTDEYLTKIEDSYLKNNTDDKEKTEKLFSRERITVLKLLHRVSTFSDLSAYILSRVIQIFGNKTTQALTKYLDECIENITTKHDEK